MPISKIPIDECRRILGGSAYSMTDAEIEVMRDNLERTADALYTQMVEAGRNGLDAQRWLSHFRQTGDGE
jgi:hypothetical protein